MSRVWTKCYTSVRLHSGRWALKKGWLAVGKKGDGAVTLRGKKPGGSKPQVSFRCPPDLQRYIEDTSRETGRSQTEIITDALELDRDLAVKLRPYAGNLDAAARAEGLVIDRDLAEVLARLVRAALDSGRGRK